MIIKTGSYTGNGVDNREIVTGNSADFILVKIAQSSASGGQAVMKTSTMAADAVKDLDQHLGLETGVIKSITATGFTVGTERRINESAFTYNWLAVEDDGAGDFEVGNYAGNGSDNRNISLVSITGTPAWVGVLGDLTESGFHRTNIHSGDASGWFNSTSAHTTNGIQSFGAGTFQVGTRDQVNRGSGTPAYHWFAFTEVALKFQVVSWTGNATDNQSVTGAGFTPTFSLHQRITASGQTMALRGPGHVGDSSSLISNTDDVANLIQAFESDGHQVGTHANVNTNTGAYAALFFQGAAAAGGGGVRHLALLGVGT